MEFWAVVGAGNWRKSSTIRSLTGAYGMKPAWDVDVLGRKQSMCVVTSAPQEGTAHSPAQIIAQISACKPKATHLMIALRHSGTSKAMYDADAYISAFLAHGWTLKGILIVSPEPPHTPLSSKYGAIVDYAPTLSWPPASSNAIANVVRSKWGL